LSSVGTNLQFGLGPERLKLEGEISQLKQTLADTQQRTAAKINELETRLELMALFIAVMGEAEKPLSSDKALRESIFQAQPAFVMSVDIRRSTELMLKATSPDAFSAFITMLCQGLMSIVKQQYGLVDKFTGDGILCFFLPGSFSGKDAGYRAIKAATDCHELFREIYDKSEEYFKTITLETGLGIGIDYGQVKVTTLGTLTVIGEPVVYACRFGSAKAGQTWLNRPAYTALRNQYGTLIDYTPEIAEIKNEGRIRAYNAVLKGEFAPDKPDWAKKLEAPKAATPAPEKKP
jgi:class 3 adenylate cyclase